MNQLKKGSEFLNLNLSFVMHFMFQFIICSHGIFTSVNGKNSLVWKFYQVKYETIQTIVKWANLTN